MTTRREFLKVGVMGGLGLAALGAFYAWRRTEDTAAEQGAAAGREVFAAIVPVVLAAALPEGEGRAAAVSATVAGVQRAVAGLSANAQAELEQLFALLRFSPTRILLAGMTEPWERASAAEVGRFLERWRFSRLALLRSAYAALHDLVLGAWYAQPQNWTAIGYAGPPELIG